MVVVGGKEWRRRRLDCSLRGRVEERNEKESKKGICCECDMFECTGKAILFLRVV